MMIHRSDGDVYERLLVVSLPLEVHQVGERTVPSCETLSKDSLLLLNRAVEEIEQGRYLRSLHSCLEFFGHTSQESSLDDFASFEQTAKATLEQVIGKAATSGTVDSLELKALYVLGVSSLCAFVQSNVTGPSLNAPESPFDVIDVDGSGLGISQTSTANMQGGDGSDFGRDSISLSDRWAASMLAENGEDLIGKVSYLQYLWLAVDILYRIPSMLGIFETNGEKSASRISSELGFPLEWYWWSLRSILMQQRILAGRSAVLRERLNVLKSILVQSFDSASDISKSAIRTSRLLSNQKILSASLFIEISIMETIYGDIGETNKFVERASSALGFHTELTGAMGIRTIHQQDPRAQLLLRLQKDSHADADSNTDSSITEIDGLESFQVDSVLLEGAGLDEDVKGLHMESSDVLQHPQIVESETVSDNEILVKDMNLSALQQALILVLARKTKKSGAPDELQPWEIIAYTDAVLQQAKGEFMIRAAARLLVTRSERSRSRTRERALLTLEGLASALHEGRKIGARDRIRCAFSTWFPLYVSLRKELGEGFVAHGLIGAALPIFEALELWDNLIVCYRLLDKRVVAEELVKRRLESTPDDPRLWCALGDLNMDDKFYHEAWERSQHRSARAQRSLARSANRRSDFEAAAEHWELALQLNPLHADGWFSLGWAYMKVKDYQKAMNALTRAAQMDPDNGEAWNNLAAVHMQLERWHEAFLALNEAVKYKRDSWQTWENFAMAASHVEEWQAVVRAMSKTLTLSQGERLQASILGAVVDQVEKVAHLINHSSLSDDVLQRNGTTNDYPAENNGGRIGQKNNVVETESSDLKIESIFRDENHDEGELGTNAPPSLSTKNATAVKDAEIRGAGFFIQSVKNLMKQIANTPSSDSIFWGLYARFLHAIGELDASKECRMKQVRALQGRSWVENEASFSAYANACMDLAKVNIDIGCSKDLSQARMLLRGAIKASEEKWQNHEILNQLKSQLDVIERTKK